MDYVRFQFIMSEPEFFPHGERSVESGVSRISVGGSYISGQWRGGAGQRRGALISSV